MFLIFMVLFKNGRAQNEEILYEEVGRAFDAAETG